jgi:hypothetical protein
MTFLAVPGGNFVLLYERRYLVNMFKKWTKAVPDKVVTLHPSSVTIAGVKIFIYREAFQAANLLYERPRWAVA